MDCPSKHEFLDALGISYPSNDGASDGRRFDGERGAERCTIQHHIDAALVTLRDEALDPFLVRELWTAALLKTLVPSNPYREPLDERAVYGDWMFLQLLADRLSHMLHNYETAWLRAPRSFDETGHF